MAKEYLVYHKMNTPSETFYRESDVEPLITALLWYQRNDERLVVDGVLRNVNDRPAAGALKKFFCDDLSVENFISGYLATQPELAKRMRGTLENLMRLRHTPPPERSK